MTTWVPWAGVVMLAVLVAVNILCKTPLWTLLLGVSSAFAALGLAFGVFTFPILSAMPSRVFGLLDNDLLQALPLYVLVGFLIAELGVGDAVFALIAGPDAKTSPRPAWAALGLGACIGPMNGSVASSSALLGGVLTPKLQYLGPEQAIALVSASATIGVIVPPSLVLLLLGDAMMRAHTEAMQLSGRVSEQARIINTQDVFHAALLPALLLVLLWALLAWLNKRQAPAPTQKASLRQTAAALFSMLGIAALLAGVFSGVLLAVEAAATAALVLVLWAIASGCMGPANYLRVLSNTVNLSGALMALLIGATVFSLVLRLFGTDRWLSECLLASTLTPTVVAALVLLAVAACAWALDAFEMVFVVVPIVAPPLIVMLGDAQQVAVLLLFTLQMSFLVPPLGYAVMIARAKSPNALPISAIARALAPYLACQVFVLLMVFSLPRLVHGLDAAEIATPALSSEQVDDALESLVQQGRSAKP
jgi:TRAP-type mannitol/chloroaromatic compound transport system permease large subunit